MASLTVTLATRGRPVLLAKCISQYLSKIRLRSTKFVVALDSDDTESIEVAQRFSKHKYCVVDVREREDSVAAKWNRGITVCPADYYLAASDDSPMESDGFDKLIVEAPFFPDQIGGILSYMSTMYFSISMTVSHRFAELQGELRGYDKPIMFVERYPYWFIDHDLDDILHLINRVAFAPVRISQVDAGKATQELREPAFWGTFFDAGYLERRKFAFDLINHPSFQVSEWRRKILLSGAHVRREYQSRAVNNGLRLNSGLPVVPGTEPRYDRLKEAAMRELRSWYPDLEADRATWAGAGPSQGTVGRSSDETFKDVKDPVERTYLEKHSLKREGVIVQGRSDGGTSRAAE
jgi:hypothetical protein